jgi:hypothetical protein
VQKGESIMQETWSLRLEKKKEQILNYERIAKESECI